MSGSTFHVQAQNQEIHLKKQQIKTKCSTYPIPVH